MTTTRPQVGSGMPPVAPEAGVSDPQVTTTVVGPAAGSTARRVIPQLTGIRALAALWVALFHFRPYLLESFPKSWPLMPLANVGHLGVDLFFLLSGFILTFTHLDRMVGPWQPRKVLGFLWLRLSRVWPVTMVMLLVYGVYRLVQLYITGDPGYADAMNPWRFLQHVLLVQAWGTGHHDWNPIDWSISAEWMAYLAFGFLVLLLARVRTGFSTRGMVGLAAIALVPIVMIGASLQDGSDLTWNGDEIIAGIAPLRVLSEFFAGALVALVVERLHGRRVPWFLRPWTVGVAIVLVVYALQRFDPAERPRFGQPWVYNGHDLWGPAESVVVVPLFALLIGGLAMTDRGLSRVLSTRLLVWGGKVSFAYYLVHWLFLDLMLFVLGQATFSADPMAWDRRTLLLLAMTSAVGAGWLLYRYVEEPARKSMRSMLPRSIKV